MGSADGKEDALILLHTGCCQLPKLASSCGVALLCGRQWSFEAASAPAATLDRRLSADGGMPTDLGQGELIKFEEPAYELRWVYTWRTMRQTQRHAASMQRLAMSVFTCSGANQASNALPAPSPSLPLQLRLSGRL